MAEIQISDMMGTNSFPSTAVIAIEDNGTTYKLTCGALAAALKTIGGFLSASELVTNVTTSTAGSPLDATQGKALADMIAARVDNADGGTYSTLQAAATALFEGMGNGTVKVGRFTRSGVGVYIYIAYRNNANYATMLCWTYGAAKLTQINMMGGTMQTPAEFLPT